MTGQGDISWTGFLDARILQAVIAGAFVAAGWVFNGWQNRKQEARLRAERLRDVHRALYAEIGSTLANLWGEDQLAADAGKVLDQMSADPDFVPFIPREHGDYVFNAIVADIHILPRRTIDPVVAYYSQIKALSAFADDMRGASFARLPQERRMAMYRDYIAMKEQLLKFGVYATAMIAAYAEGGNAAADRVRERLSSRDAGRSDPSPGSV